MIGDRALRALQDDLLDQANDILEDGEWYAASELVYEALALDPTYHRAANALLRCYLHREALREMQRVLSRLFHPEDPDYEASHQRRRRLAYSYRGLSTADLWLDWEGGDHIPAPLEHLAETLREGVSALNAAYCMGEREAYERARAAFARARAACVDPTVLAWYLARLYAELGFFAESAEALADLTHAGDGEDAPQARRLWAEVTWWRDYADRLPWIH